MHCFVSSHQHKSFRTRIVMSAMNNCCFRVYLFSQFLSAASAFDCRCVRMIVPGCPRLCLDTNVNAQCYVWIRLSLRGSVFTTWCRPSQSVDISVAWHWQCTGRIADIAAANRKPWRVFVRLFVYLPDSVVAWNHKSEQVSFNDCCSASTFIGWLWKLPNGSITKLPEG